MGLFDKMLNIINEGDKIINKAMDEINTINNGGVKQSNNTSSKSSDDLEFSSTSHLYEDIIYEEDCKYKVTFMVNDSFSKDGNNGGEVMFVNIYTKLMDQLDAPYIGLDNDNPIYEAVEEFKKTGKVYNTIEFTPLNNKFYFKAKIKYYEGYLYYYGFDPAEGKRVNYGLCVCYPKKYLNTNTEKELMKILDEAANSYTETKI